MRFLALPCSRASRSKFSLMQIPPLEFRTMPARLSAPNGGRGFFGPTP